MKTIFKNTLLSLALLAGAFTAQAQVKVGLNPATITPNSNLEVQADNGKKVIVNKPLGTVQVENLPTGAVTDKVVTAGPTGVLNQIDAGLLVNASLPISSMSTNTSTPQNVTTGVAQILEFDQTDYDPQGLANTGTNKFTIKKTGYYLYTVRTRVSAPVTNLWFVVGLMKNAPAISDPNFWSSQIDDVITASWANGLANAEFHGIALLNAGDTLELVGSACAGTGCSGTYTISKAVFTIQYVGN